MGWRPAKLANEAGNWPRDVAVTEAEVEAFEAGEDLAELKHAAICEALYREGYGVVVINEGSAGAGVRWALPAERRAEGTHHDRVWRPRIEALKAQAARQKAWDAFMLTKHGPYWWANPQALIAPPPHWEPPGEQTNGQSDPDAVPGSHAP